MRLQILDEAERDLIEGSRFYEMQGSGLGEFFLDTLFSDIESLRLYAGVHEIHFGFYRLLSKRFPYSIYYRIDSDTIQVWAVLDHRRDPDRISQRLGTVRVSEPSR